MAIEASSLVRKLAEVTVKSSARCEPAADKLKAPHVGANVFVGGGTDFRTPSSCNPKPSVYTVTPYLNGEMDAVMQFEVGMDEPPGNVSISCAQVVLLTNFAKAKCDSYRLIRKLSRQEIVNVGKPGRKGAEQLLVELLTKSPPRTVLPSTPSSTKVTSEAPTKSKKFSKSKNAHTDARTNQNMELPGNVYASLAKPCPHCNCKRVRVVNTGRLDGRNIMECTNRDCLATIKFTDIPAGTLINPGGAPEEFTWYDMDPEEMFYPSAITLKRLQESLRSSPKKPFIPNIRYDEQGNIVVRCPGQRELVKLK